MQAIIVSDASCLILLDNIGELSLLQKFNAQIFTTTVIAEEFGKELPDWIEVKKVDPRPDLMILYTILDRGEASAIALAAEHKNSLLIIDEAKGRKYASDVGISIIGTLGIIAEAKSKGYITSVKPILEKIKQTNFRYSPALEKVILEKAGEN